MSYQRLRIWLHVHFSVYPFLWLITKDNDLYGTLKVSQKSLTVPSAHKEYKKVTWQIIYLFSMQYNQVFNESLKTVHLIRDDVFVTISCNSCVKTDYFIKTLAICVHQPLSNHIFFLFRYIAMKEGWQPLFLKFVVRLVKKKKIEMTKCFYWFASRSLVQRFVQVQGFTAKIKSEGQIK